MKKIARYEDILNHYDSMAEVIITELKQIKKEYERDRRTAVENAAEGGDEEKKIEAKTEVVFLIDRFGYVRTIDKGIYERIRKIRRQ